MRRGLLVPADRIRDTDNLPHCSVTILGSTGSIGRSTLEVIRAQEGKFRVFALAAGGNDERLAVQIKEFEPEFVALQDQAALTRLRDRLADLTLRKTPELLCGAEGMIQLATHAEVDCVVAAVVGIAGLRPVLAALEAGKKVALANKESLVAAGELVTTSLNRGCASLVPVDSEHSAIFQALQGERLADVSSLVLTASGGPFLTVPIEKFPSITPAEAVQHPRWTMGPKISVDSATMFNKALEVIEAHWLYGISEDDIEVLVHPQSIVHSMVRFHDGTMMAQMSVPDMKGPIAYALAYPHGRLGHTMPRLDLSKAGQLDFFDLDKQKFPAIRLAKASLREGGASPAVFNIANEVAVERFFRKEIRFSEISSSVEAACTRYAGLKYSTLEDLLAIEARIRRENGVHS